jgi:pSer/pThr/pTyr-binding forkhead associated (FHA) protein
MKIEFLFTEGPFAGKEISITEPGTYVFGRSDQAYFVFENDLSISRFHFLIDARHDRVMIRDLGSLNKTWVNGQQLGGRAEQQPVITQMANVINLDDIDRSNFVMELLTGDSIRAGKVSTLKVMTIVYDLECNHCGKVIEATSKPAQGNKAGFTCGECTEKENYEEQLRKTEAEQEAANFIEEILNKITLFEKPAELPALPGYQIQRRIGGGGNGDVYLGKSLTDGRMVAVKVIRPEICNNRSVVERFIDRDINIGKQLSHGNIVQTIESKFIDGMYFIVMEFVEGSDISKYQSKHGLFKPREACELIIHTLDGLEYMHRHDIVHRDIKPENILLTQSGKLLVPKISDFGLAKNLKSSKNLTKPLEIAGTIPYMAPEQIMDFKNTGFAADIYSLGATLYFMCTNCFVRDYPRGEDPIYVNLNEKSLVPIEQRTNDVPVSIARVINNSIAHHPGRRIRSAGEMKQALESAIL